MHRNDLNAHWIENIIDTRVDACTTKTNENSKNNSKSDWIVPDTSARWKYEENFDEFCMNFVTIELPILFTFIQCTNKYSVHTVNTFNTLVEISTRFYSYWDCNYNNIIW